MAGEGHCRRAQPAASARRPGRGASRFSNSPSTGWRSPAAIRGSQSPAPWRRRASSAASGSSRSDRANHPRGRRVNSRSSVSRLASSAAEPEVAPPQRASSARSGPTANGHQHHQVRKTARRSAPRRDAQRDLEVSSNQGARAVMRYGPATIPPQPGRSRFSPDPQLSRLYPQRCVGRATIEAASGEDGHGSGRQTGPARRCRGHWSPHPAARSAARTASSRAIESRRRCPADR